MEKMPVAVIGAGLIGKMHIDRALKHSDVVLAGIADPTPEGEQVARSVGVPWFADHLKMIETAKPRGVVVATPNVTHTRITIDCLERGLAVIVEKPIDDTVEEARRICDASARTGLPVLVGHHRRYEHKPSQVPGNLDRFDGNVSVDGAFHGTAVLRFAEPVAPQRPGRAARRWCRSAGPRRW